MAQRRESGNDGQAGGRVLSLMDFARELIEFYEGRTRRLFEVIGFCYVYKLSGSPTAGQIARGKYPLMPSRATVYTYLKELRDFRFYLVGKGYRRVGITTENKFEGGLDELGQLVEGGHREAITDADRQIVELFASHIPGDAIAQLRRRSVRDEARKRVSAKSASAAPAA